MVSLNLGNAEPSCKNKIGPKGAKYLHNLLNNNEFLELLDLQGTLLGDQGAYQISKSFRRNCKLVQLNLSNNEITPFGMEFLQEALCEKASMNSLEVLDLSQNPLGNMGVTSFSKFLRHENCKLKSLNILDCKFYGKAAEGFWASVRQSYNLETLIADNNDFSSGMVGKAISLAISISLVHLQVNNCKLGDKGGAAIADAIARSKHLKVLQIS